MRDMTCTGWLCSLRRTTGRSRKECEEDRLCKKQSVNEEYLEAFRTKSYIEICNKAQGGIGKTSTKMLTSSSSSSIPLCMQLTEYLLEPRQEMIANITQRLKLHHLLVDYFEASLEACRCCDTILEAIHSMRLSYRRITRIVKLSKTVLDDDDTKGVIYRELASFALQNNPLSVAISSVKFRDIHDRYVELLKRLKSTSKEIRRRLTLKRVCKKVAGIALITSHSVVLVALLVFAFHSIVGLVAAPSIVGGLVGLFVKKGRQRFMSISSNNNNNNCEERLCEQLDLAAKGVYVLINDLDTMSRMVKRLNDEVEHRKVVAEVCVRNGKSEILLKQVMRDFHEHESSFLEQLEELEGHIYLCFLTTNRSRRLVVQQITDKKVKH
ncbi:hypothetical protein AAZX31_17G246500 [Glycine max]|uniref:Uncharacterized protein n=2 Tax=Glycine subgen. Soja TaxID=1462606 RepID=I1MY53_SOYBN|nr:UPF0496 protein At1g20180 [Glycine max]XP_028210057.1 UPF0496 protein At1g20180-like [Glycine soja]KAH1120200.1 hypothetical protein GYH30_048518 [Glycine max]KRH05986.1 hypothetical protein GLYMA_17G260200v4 [Glycine max]RZB58753.1 UPF0496 protein [Glycine soja]|eukprot:XP_003549471.2 UPF0496 protein At1g20180 [Glycine max]